MWVEIFYKQAKCDCTGGKQNFLYVNISTHSPHRDLPAVYWHLHTDTDGGGRTRGREYSWGTVNIENPVIQDTFIKY